MIMKNVPKWLKSYLKDNEIAGVESAVAEAEKKTSGEIVPMIVRTSSTTGHVPVILALVLLLGAQIGGVHEWLAYMAGGSELLWWGVDFVVVLGLAILLSRFDFIDRWLTPKQDQLVQVAERAELEFYEHGIGKTDESTGILIFASLMEHRVVVLADTSIAAKLPPEKWQEVVGTVVSGIKSGKLANGFSKAISQCGDLLAQNFPIRPDDENELKNHLIIKE